MSNEFEQYMVGPLGEEALTDEELKDAPKLAELEEIKGTKFPYAFSMGVISGAGYLSLENPIENSYLKGVHHIGPVPGEHRISKDHPTTDFSAEVVKVRIGMDLGGKNFYWQGAERRVKMCGWKPCFYWKWHGRNVIYSW